MSKVTERIIGLDLLRCSLMLLGPIFHTGLLFSSDDTLLPAFNIEIQELSSIATPFRMDLFFFISGYLTFLILDKKDIEPFRNGRVRGLFVPSMFATVIILPLTNIIYSAFSTDNMFHFHHIWFLIVLCIFNLLPYYFPDIYINITSRLAKLNYFKIISFYVISAVLMWKVNIEILKLSVFENEQLTDFLYTFIIFPIKYYLPFIAGSVIYAKGSKFKITTTNLLVTVALYLITYISYITIQNTTYKSLVFLNYTTLMGMAIILSVVLFFFFKNIKLSPTKWLSFVTQSALTFYLLHQLFVFLLGGIVSHKIENHYYLYLMICSLTYVISFLSYVLIRKNDLLQKLFGIRKFSKPFT